MEFERSAITRFMRDLPVRKVPGFGRVTERCLEGLGVEVSDMLADGAEIQTCGDIYAKRVELLVMDHWFGFRGLWYVSPKLGLVDGVVKPTWASLRMRSHLVAAKSGKVSAWNERSETRRTTTRSWKC